MAGRRKVERSRTWSWLLGRWAMARGGTQGARLNREEDIPGCSLRQEAEVTLRHYPPIRQTALVCAQ